MKIAPGRLARRLALAAGILVALYAIAGFLLVPRIARGQIEELGTATLHRKVEVGGVRFNPFTLRAALTDLRVMEADGRTPFVTVAGIEAAVSGASLLQRAPVVSELHIDRPSVHWVRTGPGTFSTDDIAAALSAGRPQTESARPVAPTPPVRFSLVDFRLEGGSFLFDDLPGRGRHSVTDLHIALPRFSTLGGAAQAEADPALRAIVDGSPVQARGSVRPFAAVPEATLDLDLEHFDLSRVEDLVPGLAAIRVPSGRLDLHLQVAIQLESGQEPRLGLRGRLALADLRVETAAGKLLLGLPRVDLDLKSAQFPAGRLEAELRLQGGGRLAVAGDASFLPLHLALDTEAAALDLLPLQPLFADRVNVILTSAKFTSRGHVEFTAGSPGPARFNYKGDARLDRLATIDRTNGVDFVKWGSLAVQGVDFRSAPFALAVDRIDLNDYYARIILGADGRLNVQDIVRSPANAQRSITSADELSVARSAKESSPAVAQSAKAGSPAAPIPITVRKIVLKSGHVRFSDRFIRPNYNAELADLGGTVDNLSPDPATRSQIDLRGRVNEAPLLVAGSVRPFSGDLSLDLQASVKGMDIAPFTPYSSKYIGYKITGGKLSFDVNYRVEKRQLTATNRLVLDQLELGDRVEGASLSSLPVRFAISLLKDRNGVIDIELPISGSIDAPDFSVTGIVFRALGHLITQTVTAPFEFLGSLFGGGSKESWVAFPPGRADLAPVPVAPALATMARAMSERPGLQLEITGLADLAADGEAIRHQMLERKLRALRRSEALARAEKAGPSAPPPDSTALAAPIVAGSPEYEALLRRLAAREEPPAPKAAATAAPPAPAGAQGKAGPEPIAEIEKRALARIEVTESDLIALGYRRGQWVRDWLAGEGKVGPERLFLQAGRTAEERSRSSGAPEGAPAGRVEFRLKD